jgi:SRSO17 transposase
MIRIADYPGVVKDYLEEFNDLFSRPQLRHFAEYITGLLVCKRANIKQINNSFIGHREYSNKDRFMRESPWPEEDVDDRRIELIKKRIRNMREDKGCLAIDDTIIEKTGDKIAEVGTLYDHARKRYVLGHNLVTSQYVTPFASFPIGFRLYCKKDKKEDGFKTKIELAEELVEQAVDKGLRFKTVIFDAWFLSKDFAEFIQTKKLNWISPAKSNRIITVKGERIKLEKFHSRLTESDFEKIEIEKKSYYCFLRTVKMSKLGKVRLLIAHEEEDLTDSPKYIVANNPRWDARRILKVYKSRWQIEIFYRDSKQNLGLQDYEMRDLQGIKRHWYLVFLSYSLLTLSSLNGKLRRWITTNVKTIGESCRMTTAEIIRDFMLWVLKQNDMRKSAEEIIALAFEPGSKIGERFHLA